MEWYIYCKEGESLSLCLKSKKTKLNGFVLMKERKPSSGYICKDNGDGTGEWIVERKEYNKICKFFLQKRKQLAYIIKTVNYLKRICNNMLSKIPIKYLNEIFYIIGYLKNLLKPNDINKKLTYFVFLLSFSCIIITDKTSTIHNICISLIAAPFFNLFISIIPRENNKLKKARKYGKIIGELSEIKNSQYINIHYLTNTWNEESMYDKKIDIAMNKEKATKILKLIHLNINKKTQYIPNFLKMKYFNYSDKSNVGYYNFAHIYFKEKLTILMQIANDELFPNFEEVLSQIHELNIEQERIINKFSFSQDFEIGEYITKQFIFIEYLEYWYSKECLDYSKYHYGYDNYRLSYHDDFIQEASRIHNFSYF